jgi:integrase
MAAAFYRVCSAFLNYAEAAGWVAMPLLPRKGQAAIAPGAAHRTRVLTDAELRAIWVAAEREAPKLRVFIRMLILTAARELEVADIQLCEVDLEAARWSIPASRTKNGRAIILPLCPLALTELRLIWPAKAADVVTLLGRSGKTGFRGFSRLKERIDDSSKVAGWRWHDLRRTARTGMTRLGVSADHAEAALNHVSHRSPLERTYDQHDYTPEIAAAIGRWQAHVAKIIGPTS